MKERAVASNDAAPLCERDGLAERFLEPQGARIPDWDLLLQLAEEIGERKPEKLQMLATSSLLSGGSP